MEKKYTVTCRETYLYEYEVTAKNIEEATDKAKSLYENSSKVDDGYLGVADGNTFERVSFDLKETEGMYINGNISPLVAISPYSVEVELDGKNNVVGFVLSESTGGEEV